MLIPCTCLSSEMGAITMISDSRHISGMEYVGLLRCSISQGSKRFLRNLPSCKISPHVPGRSHHSQPSGRKTWLSSTHDLNAATHVSLNRVVSQKSIVESNAEALPTPAVTPCKHMIVLAVVLSTVLGSTDARAGVESTLQPKFSGLVDASTNKVSSVEAILAKQLARRFREMSDEELILVLQELLKASRSLISPDDLVLDGKGSKDYLFEDGIKEDKRKPVEDAPEIQDPLSQSKQAGKAGNGEPESSAPRSKFVPKNVTGDDSKPVDGTDRASDSEGGREGLEMSVPGSKSVGPAPNPEKLVVPDTGGAPSFGRETASEEDLTVKKSGSPGYAQEERDEVEQSSEQSDEVGESNSQDMTGILWDEWKRRLKDQTIPGPADSEESSRVSIAANVWQKMQSSLQEASDISALISDKREAVTGGVLAYGSIALVLFIRQRILALSSGKGSKEEAQRQVDRTRTKGQLSAPNLKDSGQDPWSFLQALPASFKAARNRLLGLQDSSAQVEEKASSGPTTSSNSSGGSTMAASNDAGLNVESSLGDDMLAGRQVAREKSANRIQNSSYAQNSLRPSEQLPDRFVKRSSDRQGERGSSGPKTRFKRGVETRDAVYDSALDDLGTLQSSDLRGRKGGKGDDEAERNPQFPPSTSTTVNDSRGSLESLEREEDKNRYFADDVPFTRTRGPSLTPSTKEESSSAGKSFLRSVQGITVGKRIGSVPREKVELAPSERGPDVGEYISWDSKFLQKDSAYQRRDTDGEGNSVPESTNKPFFWPSSRPIQLDPLAYSRKTTDKEVDEVDSQSRFDSASVFPDKMEGGVGRSKSASTKSMSFVTGRSDRIDGEKGRPSSSVQVAQGEEVPSNSVGSDASALRSSKTFARLNGGSNRREDYSLGTDPPQKTSTDDLLGTLREKQKLGSDDPLRNNKSTLAGVSDPLILLTEHADAAGNQADDVRGAANLMETQSRGFHTEKLNGQSSEGDLPYSTVEEIRVGDSVSRNTVGSPDLAPQLLPKLATESSEASQEEEWDVKVPETPASSNQAATHWILQEMIHDERKVSPAPLEPRLLESEAVRSDEDAVRVPTSNADAADTDRDVVWASSKKSLQGAEGFKDPYNGSTQEKSGDFGASPDGGREYRIKIAGQSRSELDSFFHKQDFWVRDSDGVFIKHPRESQGKMLQERGGSRASDIVRDLKNEGVDAWVAPKRVWTKKVNRDSDPTGETRLQKQRRGVSSGFDYRRLYLTPKDDSKTPGQQFESKTSGSKRLTSVSSSSDSGKTRPIRYGVERTS